MFLALAVVVAAAVSPPSDAELKRAWKGNDVYCETDLNIYRPISSALKTLEKRGLSKAAARFLAFACATPFDRVAGADAMRAALDAGPRDVVSVEVRRLLANAALREKIVDVDRALLPLLVEKERVFIAAIMADTQSIATLSDTERARIVDGYRKALAADPTSTERQMCLAGTLARIGELDEAVRALPAQPAFAWRRKNIEAAAAAVRGDVQTVIKLLKEADDIDLYKPGQPNVAEDASCWFAMRKPGCTIARALIAKGKVDVVNELRVDDCGAIAEWSARNESPFDSYVRHLQRREYGGGWDKDEIVREPRLLAKLGRNDLALERLAGVRRRCDKNAKLRERESMAPPDVCAAVDVFVASLGSSTSTSTSTSPATADAKLIARLSAPAIWRSYDVVAPPANGKIRPPAKLDVERFSFGGMKPVFVDVDAKTKRAVVVTYSRDLDPRGETSMGGYVVYLSNDAGKTWDGPFHTGFASGFPFEARRKTTAPPFDGDVLQLPVDVREVDPASITFPPVGMKLLRNEENRIVRIPLSTLKRDSDGDTLTDIVEERLATDANDVDTDDDGTPDAFDRMPLEKRATGGDVDVIARFVAKAMRVDQLDAIVPGEGSGTVVSDEKLSLRTTFYSGTAPLPDVAGRALRLSDVVIEVYSKKLGPIFPVDVDVVMSADKKRAVVHLDEGWRYIAVLVEVQPDGTLKTTTLRQFIT